MRNIHLCGLALFAMLAFGAVVATSAFAVEPQWLLNGAKIEGEKLVAAVMEGELELEDMNATGGAVAVLCSLYYHLWLFRFGLDETLSLLSLTGVQITEAKPLICSFVKKGACTGTEASVVPLNLGWHTQVIHYVNPFLVLFWLDFVLAFPGKEAPGYLAECSTLLGKIDDKCTGETAAEMKNVTGGVEETFTSEEELTPSISCSLGGEKQGLLKGKFVATSTEGTLAVSEV